MNDAVKRIYDSLCAQYAPHCVILYGSYAEGTSGPESDFDALLICDEPAVSQLHDRMDGIQLDVYMYASEQMLAGVDPQDFLQVYDGILLRDEHGVGQKLITAVRDYVESQPPKTAEEKRAALAWCEKMLKRAQRGDAEGYYRWHWLLTESLTIYCELRDWFYFGPKKTLLRMQKEAPGHYALYQEALRNMHRQALQKWTDALHELLQ